MKCFLVQPTNRFRLYLRRYADSQLYPCPAGGYHEAMPIGGEAVMGFDFNRGYWITHDHDFAADDPRWPVKCDKCAYVFTAVDHKHTFHDRIFVGEDGTDYVKRNAPAGMMWHDPLIHHPTIPADANRSGIRLSTFYWRDWAKIRAPIMVVCPGGQQWCIDQKSSNGEGWEVTGDAPNLTCAPSIDMAKYHGYLRNGSFTPDLNGRTYEV